jgi:hypothetical protein
VEIKGRLDLGEFLLLPVQNHFCSPVLSKNIKFQIFKLKFCLLFYMSVTSWFITIKTHADNISAQGAQEDILAQAGEIKRKLEKISCRGLS